jgi:hypothetical protein
VRVPPLFEGTPRAVPDTWGNYLRVVHLEFIHNVFGVLRLMHKGSFLGLFDLNPEEELQLTHHGHLELPAHALCKPERAL